MIVLEVRCGLSRGRGKQCRNLLGYVDSDLQILYKDQSVGFINQCTQRSHIDDDFQPFSLQQVVSPGALDFLTTPGAKIPGDWQQTLPIKIELITAARDALADGVRLPTSYLWPNVRS